MTDNVTVNAGTFATDDVDGVHYQRIKLDLGGDGVASPLIRGQQSAASALPVVGASDLDGVATDTPSTDEEGAAARTKISLLKGIKNYLRTLATGVTVSSSALPTGAATAAKQPALGTVGNPSADVLSVQDVVAPWKLVPNSTQADQALTVDATVGGVQFAAFHADTTAVEFDVQTADVRVTFDGSAPTSTNGHLLPVGYSDIWPKAKAAAAKFIRTGATSAVVHASQLKGA